MKRTTDTRRAVIAGSYHEALTWAQAHGIRRRDLHYIGSFDQLDGLLGEVLLVGRFEQNRAIRHARALAARGTIQLVEAPE